MEPNVRLKRVSGKQTTTLTLYGRRTGKPYEVTIWFVLDDDTLYIGTANTNRQWVRDVPSQKMPKIRLSIGILSGPFPPPHLLPVLAWYGVIGRASRQAETANDLR